MKMSDIVVQANNNLWRNKLRTILTVIAIFVGSFTIILTSAINTGVNSFIDRQVSAAGGEGYIEMMPDSFREQLQSMTGGGGPIEYNPDANSSDLDYISPETLEKIEQLPHITPGSVRPLRNVSAEYVSSNETDKRFKISLNVLPSNTINIDLVSGNDLDLNADQPQILLAPDYATALGFDSDEAVVGQKITLAVKNTATTKISYVEVTVAGVQAPSLIAMGRSWINNALSDQLFEIASAGMPPAFTNRVMFATAEFDPNISDSELTELKDSLLELGIMGTTVSDSIGMLKTFFDAITAVLLVFGAIALLAASIGIINTLFMSVQERTREIGLMKAMGMSSGKIFLSFSFEAIMIGFWGSVFGIIVSMIVGNIGNSIAHEYFLKDLPTFQLVEFTIPNLILITLLIMFIAFLAGTMPAVRAAKKDPIEALRYE